MNETFNERYTKDAIYVTKVTFFYINVIDHIGSFIKTSFDSCSRIFAGVNVIGVDTSRIRFNKSYTKETGNEPDHTEWAKKGCDFMTVIRFFFVFKYILLLYSDRKAQKLYKH